MLMSFHKSCTNQMGQSQSASPPTTINSLVARVIATYNNRASSSFSPSSTARPTRYRHQRKLQPFAAVHGQEFHGAFGFGEGDVAVIGDRHAVFVLGGEYGFSDAGVVVVDDSHVAQGVRRTRSASRLRACFQAGRPGAFRHRSCGKHRHQLPESRAPRSHFRFFMNL